MYWMINASAIEIPGKKTSRRAPCTACAVCVWKKLGNGKV